MQVFLSLSLAFVRPYQFLGDDTSEGKLISLLHTYVFRDTNIAGISFD